MGDILINDRNRTIGKPRIEGLDVLRGFAVLLVLVGHALPTPLRAAALVGVILFFTLSGYLITGILMKDLSLRGRVHYVRFYRNRALRLIPALLFMLLGLTIVTLIADPLGDRSKLFRGILVALTYTANIPFDHGSAAIAHLWTLATEEQFYLVWPILLALGVKLRRLRALVTFAGLAVFATCLGTVAIFADDVIKIYTLPSSWALTMVIGAAARLGQDQVALILPAAGRVRAGVTVTALALITALCFVPTPSSLAVTYTIIGPLVAVIAVVLIFHLRTWQRIPSVSLRPLLALGTISYAAYLWNYPIALWVDTHASRPIPAAASIVLTLIAASISWWLVEKPVHSWRVRMDTEQNKQPSAASA